MSEKEEIEKVKGWIVNDRNALAWLVGMKDWDIVSIKNESTFIFYREIPNSIYRTGQVFRDIKPYIVADALCSVFDDIELPYSLTSTSFFGDFHLKAKTAVIVQDLEKAIMIYLRSQP